MMTLGILKLAGIHTVTLLHSDLIIQWPYCTVTLLYSHLIISDLITWWPYYIVTLLYSDLIMSGLITNTW